MASRGIHARSCRHPVGLLLEWEQFQRHCRFRRHSGSSSNGAGGKTVTLGLLTSLTGPLASEFGQPTVAATQARIDLANATNEVPGVKLKLVVQDDQSSPAGALAATQVLVNQDHVFAVIDASALFAAAYKYTVQNNVPVLGWGDSTEFSDPG